MSPRRIRTEGDLVDALAAAGFDQAVADKCHDLIRETSLDYRARGLADLLVMLGVLGPEAK